MKKCFVLVALLLTFSMPAVAVNYLQVSVTSGLIGSDGYEILSVLTLMDTHLVDAVWTAPNQYREMTHVAGDYLSSWYSVLGPDSSGKYKGYIFSGLDVDSGQNVSTIFQAVGDLRWDITLRDNAGNTIFYNLMSGGKRSGTSLIPVPAGLNQKRTLGYALTVAAVPEPVGLGVLVTGLIGLLGYRRRR